MWDTFVQNCGMNHGTVGDLGGALFKGLIAGPVLRHVCLCPETASLIVANAACHIQRLGLLATVGVFAILLHMSVTEGQVLKKFSRRTDLVDGEAKVEDDALRQRRRQGGGCI